MGAVVGSRPRLLGSEVKFMGEEGESGPRAPKSGWMGLWGQWWGWGAEGPVARCKVIQLLHEGVGVTRGGGGGGAGGEEEEEEEGDEATGESPIAGEGGLS